MVIAVFASYFQGLTEEAEIQFEVEGNARVAADATLSRRAVSNVMSNALEHAFPGSSVELCASDSAKYTVIEVTNQGHAIAPEHVDIFSNGFIGWTLPGTAQRRMQVWGLLS
jgi:two-component system heavy metal sensor histidine kinase CusS